MRYTALCLSMLFCVACSHADKKTAQDNLPPNNEQANDTSAQAKTENGLDGLTDPQEIFFKKHLFTEIRDGHFEKAESMLNEEIKIHPEYASAPLYFSAKSLMAFHKKDYQEAYVQANKVVEFMEDRFAPRKPYQVRYDNDQTRHSISAHYLYRYQALMKLGKYSEALQDVESAEKIFDSPRIQFIKTSLLLLLNRYEEAAKALNKAYKTDKNILIKQGNAAAARCCEIFAANKIDNVKACKDLTNTNQTVNNENNSAKPE